jgi:hypothetical protein
MRGSRDYIFFARRDLSAPKWESRSMASPSVQYPKNDNRCRGSCALARGVTFITALPCTLDVDHEQGRMGPPAENRGLSAVTTCSENQYRDFGRDTDHNLRRARVAGYVLLAGLLLEVVSCIIWFHGIETLASIVCVALVAGGVAGEIFFEYRASLADNGTPDVTAPPISRAPHPDYSYSGTGVNRTGVHLSIGPGELLGRRNTSPSPNNSKLLPSFPERSRRNLPSRRSRERFASR